MNRHERINKLLVDFALGELSQQKETEVKTHLAECPQCGSELKRLEALLECTERMRELSADKQMCESAKQAILASVESGEIKQQTNRSNISPALIWRTIMKSPITKLAAAAVIIIGVLIGINTFSGTTALAQMVRALNEVENVCITNTRSYENGKTVTMQWWFKKPNFLREESTEHIVIDDGTDRLSIDKQEKTAQAMDSFAPWSPISEHYMFESLGLFRGKNSQGYQFTKLAHESTETILVYALKYEESFKGKAWVQAGTMLPLRIVVSSIKEPDAVKQGEISFSYDPIPVETFSVVIPVGYSEFPRKERGVLSGKVIDEQGNSVPGAVVYAVDGVCNFVVNGRTNKQGEFLFKLPPDNVEPVWLPIFLRAFADDDPSRIAWTIIRDPKEMRELGARIPGKVGHIEVDDLMLKGASGVILQMEPAGKISGLVMDIEGNSIANADVSVKCHPVDKFGNEDVYIGNLGGRGKHGEVITQTDAEGRYEFNNLPRFWDKTVFIVSASAEGYVSESIRFRSKGQMDTKKVELQLYSAGLTISGVLKDNYGELLAEREVHARVNGKDYTKCRTKTDDKGRFRLVGCPIAEGLQVKADLSHNHWPPHERERYMSYRYYPDVIVEVDCEESKTEYQVEIVAKRPEFTVEVQLKNTAGEPLLYFPVEVRGAPGTIASQWKADKKLTRRTDERGYCKFTEVPNVQNLRLVMWGGNGLFNDILSKEEAKSVENKYQKYKWTEVPIELTRGKKDYRIEVTILTNEEYKRMK